MSCTPRQPNIPTPREFIRGYKAFQRRESRDAMYRVATFLLAHFWGRPAEMADSLAVLLLTWNQAFYRFGSFHYPRLQRAISSQLTQLTELRRRDISTYTRSDDRYLKKLFSVFANALAIREGSRKGHKSPVAVAKAFHLLAPQYFPIWDEKIARAYRCHYSQKAADSYIHFMRITQDVANNILPRLPKNSRPFTKLFDEYNYAKFTKKWI